MWFIHDPLHSTLSITVLIRYFAVAATCVVVAAAAVVVIDAVVMSFE